MHKEVDTFCVANQVFAYAGVAREHDRVSPIIDPVSERRFDKLAVIHIKSCDFYTVAFVHRPFGHISHCKGHTLRRHFLVGNANTNIGLIRLLKVFHHIRGSSGSVNMQSLRSMSEWWWQPACQPKVRKASYMIGMQVREKDSRHVAQRDVQLPEPQRNASTAIEQ